MKQVLFEIDYNRFLAGPGQAQELLGLFSQMEQVKIKGSGKNRIYAPENDAEIKFSIIEVDPAQVRPETVEEKENEELKEAKSNADYYRREYQKQQETIGKLNCKISVLEGKGEVAPGTEIEG